MHLTAKHKTLSLLVFVALVALLTVGLLLSVAGQASAGGLRPAWLLMLSGAGG